MADSNDKIPFTAHLNELRIRILRILIVLVITVGISLFYTEPLLKLLATPYGSLLKVIHPIETISVFFKVALMSGTLIAIPYIVWEIWQFVSAGLYLREKRLLIPLILMSFILIPCGVAFAWFIEIPVMIKFLSGIAPDIFQIEWTPENYILFVMSVLFWTGMSFELPLVIIFLVRRGVFNAYMLIRSWRYVIIIIAIIAAFFTPTFNPFNTIIIMGVLTILYLIILLAALVSTRPGVSQ